MGSTELGDLVADVVAGERRALARLLTLVEDAAPDRLRELITALYPATGGARIVGVTGSPGVGKSTLTNALAGELRSREVTVGVIAIDPSSPFSGGALLGDRVRMQAHHADPGVFIRSMAARGQLGGLAFATPQAVLALDAAGFDVVVIETVGVGQSEVDVAATADSTVVVMAPGMGDSVQAAKAGILEVADVFAINKADRGGAGQLGSQLRSMLEAGRVAAGDGAGGAWRPVILRTVAVREEGVAELADTLDAHHAHLRESGDLAARRRRRAEHAVQQIALQQVRGRFRAVEEGGGQLLEDLAGRVADRDLDPYTAADRLLEAIDHS